MAKLLRFGILASLAAYASAKCDNQCSGHGTCMTDDVCQCYDNFGSGLSHDSGDCSDRICPFEVAWVDHPDVAGHHHKYMECAGKGICDRSTGECSCFEGYEGKGCQRSACPNDCSGHGRCDYIEDLPYGATWNDWVDENSVTSEMTSRTQSLFSDDAKMFEYHLWDKSKSRKCVCDATYGDLDCSKRLCPYGTDVLDTKDDTYYGLDEQKYQEQTILLSSLSGDFDQLASKSFALTFTSRLNETFTTVPIALSGSTDVIDLQNDIKLALLKLPNGVIDGVKVAVDYIEAAELYKLVSDNLFPSITFTATTVAGDAATGADSMSLIASATQAQTGKLAVGCSLSGDMVPRVSPTTVTAFGNTFVGGTLSKPSGATDPDEVYSGAARTIVADETALCTSGTAAITTSADVSAVAVFAAGKFITIEDCGIFAGEIASISGDTVTMTAAGTPTASASAAKIKPLPFTCTVGSTEVAKFGMALAAGDSGTPIGEFTDYFVGSGALVAGCVVAGPASEIVASSTLVKFAGGTMLKSDGTTGVYNGVATTVADTKTVTTCTVGSASITMTGTPTVSVGDWVSIPACGISAAQVKTVAAPLVLEAGGEATIAVSGATAKLYLIPFTCTLNGQLIARFGMKLADGSAGGAAHGTINSFIVGYGGLVPGCTVGGNVNIAANSILATFSVTDSWTSQQMFSKGTSKSLTCAQYYLPGTHQFTTPNGIARGQVYDYSGNYIGGQDAAVLPKIASSASDVVNHRRRLSSHSPLLSIKIGFSGPSVQGPQHLLIVEDYKCDAGCTPKLTGMPLETRQTSSYWSTIVELTKSDFNSYECGRRGKCDYATGLCQCFAGYVGDNCNTLTTLV